MSPKKFRTKKRTSGNKAIRQRMKDLKKKQGLYLSNFLIELSQFKM